MPAFSWTPTPDEVADAIPARVPDGFSDDTVPTEARVEGMIDLVAMEIVGITSTFDDALATNPAADTGGQVTLGDLAKVACIWGVACYVETGEFPEQQYLNSDSTLGSHLYRRYRDAIKYLIDAIQRNRGQDKAFSLYTGRNREKEAEQLAEMGL